tara:strand:+ start:22009 stop:22305 length:297 start_codon:yes stop_codon:yes gene_type:complete
MSKSDNALWAYIKALNHDCFDVHVTPNASANKIKIVTNDENGCVEQIRLYVTTPPEDGKANKAIIKLLSKALSLPKTSLEVKRGGKSRLKTIQLHQAV